MKEDMMAEQVLPATPGRQALDDLRFELKQGDAWEQHLASRIEDGLDAQTEAWHAYLASAEAGEWRRTWTHIEYTGGANGVAIRSPSGGGWRLLQSVHIPPAPAKRGAKVLLGSMVHVWYRPAPPVETPR